MTMIIEIKELGKMVDFLLMMIKLFRGIGLPLNRLFNQLEDSY